MSKVLKMNLEGPERYLLLLGADSYSIRDKKGRQKFRDLATSHLPKLYVVSVVEKPIYVGITKQPMRNRLRFGWTAGGHAGYYGYPWRNKFSEVNLDIWFHTDAPKDGSMLHLETIESEIVFLIRHRSGQWPMHQTEIHFHPSEQSHRNIASEIVSRYKL